MAALVAVAQKDEETDMRKILAVLLLLRSQPGTAESFLIEADRAVLLLALTMQEKARQTEE